MIRVSVSTYFIRFLIYYSGLAIMHSEDKSTNLSSRMVL